MCRSWSGGRTRHLLLRPVAPLLGLAAERDVGQKGSRAKYSVNDGSVTTWVDQIVSSYGVTNEHRTTPDYVARESLNRLGDGPIWVAEDIAAQIAAFVRMPPAERPAVAARMAAEFTRNKK